MPAPLRVILSDAEVEMLRELRVAATVPQRTRDRAHMLWLNHDGWNVPAIADMFDCQEATVRATIRRWEVGGRSGLWEAPGRGAKPRWNAADMACIDACLADETRTYNSAQIVRKLKDEGLVDLSSGQLREILKKKNYRWKRTRQSHRRKQDPVKRAAKQADRAMLKQAADDGEIQLKYLDESGFCLWSPVSYRYSPVGEQKRMEQTKPVYGWRVSILGLWQENVGFEYGLAKGGFNSRSYLELMQWIAAKAAVTLAETGQITVVVQDNGSIHQSQIVQAQWDTWATQGLIMFFLPPDCSEMNPIEGKWHQIKAHEMAGQMFDNAYDLAMAVEASVEHRYQSKAYQVERFMFNSP